MTEASPPSPAMVWFEGKMIPKIEWIRITIERTQAAYEAAPLGEERDRLAIRSQELQREAMDLGGLPVKPPDSGLDVAGLNTTAAPPASPSSRVAELKERIEAGKQERLAAKMEAEGGMVTPPAPPVKNEIITATLAPDVLERMALPTIEEIERRAMEILVKGLPKKTADEIKKSVEEGIPVDPLQYLLYIYNRDHVGDRLVGLSYHATIGCTLCENVEGLHPGTTGKSGGGKSHSMRTALHLVPVDYVFRGSHSDLAWFYSKMKTGTIIFLDDAENLKDIHRDVIKQATTTYQEGFERTISDPKNKGVVVVKIPPRCTFWVNSADGSYDFQFLNRQITLGVDEEHLEEIFEKQTGDATAGTRGFLEDDKWNVARAIWRILKEGEPVKVKIPFLDEIEWTNKENPRNWPMFLDTVSAFAAIRQFQRKRDEAGYLIAEPSDADDAMELWNSISKEQRTKLNKKQMAVMQKIVELMGTKGRELMRVDLQKALPNLTRGDLTHILKGRKTPAGIYVGGLVNMVPGLDIIPVSSKEYDADVRTKHGEVIIYHGDLDIWVQLEVLVRWKAPHATV